MAEDNEFTRLLGNHLLNAKGFYDYGIKKGLTSAESLRLTIAKRKETARALVKNGMSIRDAAKALGVSKSTVQTDVQKPDKLVQKLDKRAAREEENKAELAKPRKNGKLADGLHQGDFRELAAGIADDSVSLIFIDPPYDRKSVDLYGEAARIARRILVPGGSFIAYSGHKHLPDVYAECAPYLRYWWTMAGVHGGSKNLLNKLGIRCRWKPLVWFVKGTRADVQNILSDMIEGQEEKDQHEWQQSEIEARYCIEKLTFEGGLVVDFFAGSGTSGVAARALGRRWIGFEINLDTEAAAQERLVEL
jgi:16S rRNA G966 N2-methylase RsmD